MNEREYVEHIFAANEFVGKPTRDLCMAARYYYGDGYKAKDVKRKIQDLLLRCKSDANLVLWDATIDRQVKKAARRKLIEVDGIPITPSEMESVGRLSNRTLRQIAFTYLCVAKYYNNINDTNNNWTNIPIKELFSIAGVHATHERQFIIRGQLVDEGFAKMSVSVNNGNTRVEFIDGNEPCALMVTEFADLGAQYLRFCGEPYIDCEECGRITRKRSNRQKYCPKCARAMAREQASGTAIV